MSISHDDLEHDLISIKNALGYKCNKIALFGSVLTKGLEQAQDIDLAIFMDKPSIEYIDQKLSKLNLKYSYNSKNVAYTYGGGGGVAPDKSKGFDIVVLNNANPDNYFMLKNSHCIRFVQ